MASKDVQTHAARNSRRAKATDGLERRPVFKSVLDNPFQVAWPSTPANIQNLLLSHTVQMVDGIAAYHVRREKAHHLKRKALQIQDRDSSKRRRREGTNNNIERQEEGMNRPGEPDSSDQVNEEQPVPPPALSYLTIGINEVTRQLETRIRALHRSGSLPSSSAAPTPVAAPAPVLRTPIQLLLVCREDVNPPALVAHIPQLVASCNFQTGIPQGGDQANPVKLVVLPRGAEATLAAALGLRRVAVLALHMGMPGIENIMGHIDALPPLHAPWLVPLQSRRLEPTHIKQLRTTAPKDMKKAKEARAQGRADAKERKVARRPSR
ncbi:hypothetical protein PENSPDRAFT_645693 [Peniophora sp. CONT]|nr:hypothetical protein PENSPDRAFT_645693 [Peniophora sp. CONT]